ncbi:cation transporting ATPase C-terminal domain-containing protein, partial [Pseudomonas sp. OA3]|nr:cation transporting ATPase C-terminal domain-containing protein [Pseudomonas sp. OA3]
PTNGGQSLIVIFAILFQVVLPLTPAQVLWINMVTSSTLGLALAFEPSERGLMQRAPRAPNEPLLSGFFVWRVVMVSLLIAGAGIGLFLWELKLGNSLESARTIAVNAVVMCEIFYLFNSRSIFGSVLNRDALLGNRAVLVTIAICLVLQLLFTYAPPLQGVFGSVGLSPEEWLRVLLAGLALFAVAELEKWVVRRFGLHAQAA